jgi:Co/Zn/Cd efflux system component
MIISQTTAYADKVLLCIAFLVTVVNGVVVTITKVGNHFDESKNMKQIKK